MRYCSSKTLTICLLSVMTVSMFYSVGGAVAEPQNLNTLLRGAYASTKHLACVQNMEGFNDDLSLLSDGSTRTIATRGIVIYRGDGTGSVVEGRALGVNHDATSATQIPVSGSDFTCNLTYTVNSDLSVIINRTCNGTVVSGPMTGQTYTLSGVQLTGQIVGNGNMILISDTEPNVETIVYSVSGTRYRICNRSGMEAKLPPPRP